MLIICDFDGTVTQTDTLNHLADRFAPEAYAAVEGKLTSGEMTLREVLEHELAAMRQGHDEIVSTAVREVPLRPGFARFVEEVRQRGDRLVLVSAGFRQLIQPMLQNAGVHGVELIAHDVDLTREGGRITFRDVEMCDECGQQCKRSEVLQLRAGDEEIVYIGDGYSDRCGAEVADRILARDGLAAYLSQRGVPFRPFADFNDVRHALYPERGGDLIAWVRQAPVTSLLLVLIVAAYAWQVLQAGFSPDATQLHAQGASSAFAVRAGEWWKLLTANVLHTSPMHVGFNLFVLLLIGSQLERAAGSLYMLALVALASVATTIGALAINPLVVGAGASGINFAAMGMAFALDPRGRGELGSLARTLLVLNLVLTFVLPGISVGGHLGGLLAGLLVGAIAVAAGRRWRTPAAAASAVGAVAIAALVATGSLAAPIERIAEAGGIFS